MSDLPYLELAMFTPLAGAILLGFVPRDRVTLIRYYSLGVTLVTFAFSLGVLADFDTSRAGFQLGLSASWIPEWGIRYATGVDGISLWMVMLTAFLMPIAVLASWHIEEGVKPYFIFLLALDTGMMGVSTSVDLFSLLPLLGSLTSTHVLSYRQMGTRPSEVRCDEVLSVHARGVVVDARGDPLPRLLCPRWSYV